ncbi:sugar ABC transporter permease [Paenibacillus oryzae]|uniref:Sugar ABC transporter permease n=2 Tax=Paenibacillus oryzae TaxID=1844972 RepID=A0A1A5YPZ7_9BACL|nr:sugar ABC transporter permease [Paenibacillus oryzae]
MAQQKRLTRLFVHLLLFTGAALMILPFGWMLLTSFKTVTESTSMNPFVFFPSVWKWENYVEVLQQNNFFRLYWNTFAMVFLRIACSIVFSAMAAYAFARLKFPGRNFFFGLVLFQMMVPTQIFIIPQYLMVDSLGMRNTIFALLFPGLVSAFGTFLLRQFFMGLPKELEEAAKLDGCNIGQTFVRIMLPLVRSGMVALGIFTALFAFKDLMWPMIVNTNSNAATLSSALAKIQGAYSVDYPELMAASVLAIAPMLVLYIIFQKQFIEGVATSGGKL